MLRHGQYAWWEDGLEETLIPPATALIGALHRQCFFKHLLFFEARECTQAG
jgi:hypothetical protein